MSSQGPATRDTPNYVGFATGPVTGTPLPIGYAFNTNSISDASSWTAYKRQTLISKENKTKLEDAFPEVRYGNDYRLQFLLGRFKNPSTAGCNTCSVGQQSLFNGGAGT